MMIYRLLASDLPRGDARLLFPAAAVQERSRELRVVLVQVLVLVLQEQARSAKQANRPDARLRGPGERANAQLKSWRILRKLRCGPTKAGHLVKAIAALQIHRVAQTARG